MEQSSKSKDPWRVHVHILVGLNPSGVASLGRLIPRGVALTRFLWQNRVPNVQAVNPCRPTVKMIVANLCTLSYYVCGPKIGRVLSEATLMPIEEPAAA